MSRDLTNSGGTTLTIVLITVIVSLVILVGIILVNGKSGGNSSIENKATAAGLIGKAAPDFELEDSDGKKVKLSDLKGKNVVLFFSEGLMCYPACWDQMAKLGGDPRFNNESTVSYSIIMDPKSEWQKAFDKMPELRSTKVLFDIYGVASKIYSTLDLESSMHRGRIPGHTYFLVDKEGVVRFFYDDPQMANRNDMMYAELSKLNK